MCDLNKPLVSCTLGDFIEALSQMHKEKKPQQVMCVNMPRGLKGIMEIFNCTNYAARRIKESGVIDSAIYHLGRRAFVTDPEKAKHLYQQNFNL